MGLGFQFFLEMTCCRMIYHIQKDQWSLDPEPSKKYLTFKVLFVKEAFDPVRKGPPLWNLWWIWWNSKTTKDMILWCSSWCTDTKSNLRIFFVTDNFKCYVFFCTFYLFAPAYLSISSNQGGWLRLGFQIFLTCRGMIYYVQKDS